VTAQAGDPSAEREGGGLRPRAGDSSFERESGGVRPVAAGRVGRAHGLDGSFYVTGARPRLLALGTAVRVGARASRVTRRAGVEERPILRLEGIDDRASAEMLRGLELMVDLLDAPELGEDEWWASELEGCEVVDGERRVGVVMRLLELPSCEALEVRLAARDDEASSSGELLVPMVRDAIRRVDVLRRLIDVDMSFLEEV
jgi:16S rRNA processing protein RimM